jgi:hypothetical protein
VQGHAYINHRQIGAHTTGDDHPEP